MPRSQPESWTRPKAHDFQPDTYGECSYCGFPDAGYHFPSMAWFAEAEAFAAAWDADQARAFAEYEALVAAWVAANVDKAYLQWPEWQETA